MRKVTIALGAVLLGLYLTASFLHLDPDERRPGVSLSGNLAASQDTDWSFLDGRNKIYVQMSTWYGIPHSITTTSWVHNGELYVPCGRCESKNWPNHVARNNDVRLKVRGELYDRRAVLLTQEEELRTVMNLADGEPTPPGVWVYRMMPRT